MNRIMTLQTENIHTGNLILVNARYGLQTQPTDHLVPVRDDRTEVFLQKDAATLLNRLMEDIHGWQYIVPVSSWRSGEKQQSIWDSSLLENGKTFTRQYVALPGHSEHQSGLAITLSGNNVDGFILTEWRLAND